MDQTSDLALKKAYKKEAIDALNQAMAEKWPSWDNLFTDVYDELTPNLI